MAVNLAHAAGPGSEEKRPPFVEASTDRAWSADEIGVRVGQVAAALASLWKLIPGQPWHKIVAIVASNSVSLFIYQRRDISLRLL